MVYEHRYFPPVDTDRTLISKDENNLIYVGMTKKTWASRWKEHLHSAQTGSPGGKAGIAFAAKYGVKADTARRWEQRETVIRQIQQNAKKKGLPNPAQSLRLANDPNLMRKMIEGRDDTFHSNDIAIIRSMQARGVAWREIAQQLKVKDIYRVRDVVEGKTYKFIS